MKAIRQNALLFPALAASACLFAGYAVQSASAQCCGPQCYRPSYQPPPCTTPAWYPPVYGPPAYFPPGYNSWYNSQAMPRPSMRGQAVAPNGNPIIPPGGNQAPAPTGNDPVAPGGFQAVGPQGPGAAGSTGGRIPGPSGPPAMPSAEHRRTAPMAAPLPPPAPGQTLAERQRICPVTGRVLGSMGEPYKVRVRGRDVLLCCQGCEAKFKSDPDKYLAKLNR